MTNENKQTFEHCLFDLKQTAEMLSVSTRTVLRWVEDGSITARQHDGKGKIFFTAHDVETFIGQLTTKQVEDKND